MINKLFPRIFSLEQKVTAMETHLKGFSKIYGDSMTSDEDDLIEKNLDKALKCDKCSNFLGFFDVHNEQFRFKYKGLVVYWIAGENGSITIICNKCSFANNLGYITCENQI